MVIIAWRYQKGNQNPYFEEEQTTQWPKEKGQKDTPRSTKHTHKTKDRVTQTPLNTGVNSGAPEGLAVPVPRYEPDLSASVVSFISSLMGYDSLLMQALFN